MPQQSRTGPVHPGPVHPGPVHPGPPAADRRRHRRGVAVLMVLAVLACLPLAAVPFVFIPDGPQDYARIGFATKMSTVAAGMLAVTLIGGFIAALITRRPLAWVCTGVALALLSAVIVRLGSL